MEQKDSIIQKIRELHFYFRRSMEENISSKVNGVTPMQGFILYRICYAEENNEEFNQKDLERCLKVNKSTLSEMLNCMEKNGLIQRISSKVDSRKKIIRSTKKGNEINCEIGSIIKEFETAIENRLTKEEVSLFVSLINKLKKEG